jgi:hypothetical protein
MNKIINLSNKNLFKKYNHDLINEIIDCLDYFIKKDVAPSSATKDYWITKNIDMNRYIPLLKVKDNLFLVFHEYIYLFYPDQNNYIRACCLDMFSKSLNKSLEDILNLVSKHPSQPDLDKVLIKKIISNGLIPKGSPKVLQKITNDYIKMLNEAKFPVVNEKIINDMIIKNSSVSQFWYMYGTLAALLENEGYGFDPEVNAFYAALERYKKNISNEDNNLYPLLSHLYQEFSSDHDWAKYHGDNLPALFSNSIRKSDTYGGMFFGEAVLENVEETWRWFPEDKPIINKKRIEDFNQYKKLISSNAGLCIGEFIEGKYY